MAKVESNTGQRIEGLLYRPRPDPVESMKQYDLLPPPVRKAIGECPYRFSVETALKMCVRGSSAYAVADFIQTAGKRAVLMAESERGLITKTGSQP